MKEERQLIKVPLVFPVIIVVLFTLVIVYSKNESVIVADYEIKIDSVRINYPDDRGGFLYKDNHFISTGAVLLDNPCGSGVWRSHGPIIDFNDKPHQYTLADVKYPFLMYKHSNSDTINIVKDGCLLHFKMQWEY